MDSVNEILNEHEMQQRIKSISVWEWNTFLLRLKIAIKKFDLDAFISNFHDFRVSIAFDWVEWGEGQHFLEKDSPDFSDKDMIFCLKILSAIIRKNRIDEEYLKLKILDGFISQLMRRIDELVNNPEEDQYDFEDLMDELFNVGNKWKHRNLRTVLDIDSAEFFDTNWQEKKTILKRIFDETSFFAVLQQYKRDNLRTVDPHELNSLEKTLVHYVKALLSIGEYVDR